MIWWLNGLHTSIPIAHWPGKYILRPETVMDLLGPMVTTKPYEIYKLNTVLHDEVFFYSEELLAEFVPHIAPYLWSGLILGTANK